VGGTAGHLPVGFPHPQTFSGACAGQRPFPRTLNVIPSSLEVTAAIIPRI
jgi:hypothetical protein